VLLAIGAGVEQFRTAWFLESVISAALVVLVIRSRRPLWKGRPSPYLLIATCSVIAVTLLLPVSPLAGVLGFQAVSRSLLLAVAGIIAIYVAAAEVLKAVFYRKAEL
jgi:P-type Mg2+ transporter